ncbi:MAG TPA: histidine kinase dimerization/phospho-acceptor domain-containing protein [Polyangiales bacterium]|nr:histidine kinase dimerization/phospho-acceptor domain-containing protein [Polyangiales bacterium]
MTNAGDRVVSNLRWTVIAISSYFTLCWMLIAGHDGYWGAPVLFGLALTLGWGLLRRLIPSLRFTEPSVAPPAIHPSAPTSMEETIEAHSAHPELPERQRARFLGALGHELRNPLNSVTGFSDMLLGRIDGELNAEQEQSVRTIRAGAERLLRLVSTVVDRAKVEAGTLRLQQQWVAPDELISEAIGFVRSRAEDTSVVGGVSEGLPRVFVDKHRTVHALVSLAVLVIRSSETDIVMRVAPPRRDQVGKGFVQFDLMATLKDSSADTLTIVERLEKPLSRSDALGLEVAVARSVIEAQGGRIWTEAGTAGSLRVCMTLPTSAH